MSTTAGSGVEVVAIDTPALGDRSYLAHDGDVALVVDPQRDIDRVLALAAARGVRITHVFETHLHNDYVTGGLALAQATGAAYHVNAADQVAFGRVPAIDGDMIEVSPVMRVRVVATPGHTFTHLSYVLEAAGHAHAVFTGGSLLYGSTGRPDLLGRAHAGELAHAQYASAHRLAAELPEDADVYPTHGFGSFCSATQAEGTSSTIGREMRVNPVLVLDEQRYVRRAAGRAWTPTPPTTRTWARPTPPGLPGADLSPPRRADAAEIRRRIEAGEWVVDLRARRAFAAGHVAGTLSFDLDGSFATYLGWLIPWGTPLTLLGQHPRAGRRGPARAGPDRHRPPRRSRRWPARSSGPAAGRCAATPSRTSPAWKRSATTDPSSSWTSAVTRNGRNPTSAGPCTFPCTSCPPAWPRCQKARCGCTAKRDTGPRSPRPSWTPRAGRVVVVDDEYDRAARAGLPVDGLLAQAAAT